jgi:hypothetical protein
LIMDLLKTLLRTLGFAPVVLLVACGQQQLPSNSRQTPQTGQPLLPLTATSTIMATMTSTPLPSATAVPTGLPADAAAPTATSTVASTPTPTPAFPAYQGQPLDGAQMGAQIHIHREDIPELISHLRSLGMGWVKVQVSWKLYEPQPDQYTADRFQELDQLVHLATGNNIKVLLSVSKAPEWSRSTTELDGPPIDYTLFSDFMTYLAGRYQENVAAYELWNEPNLQREWNGSPLSAPDLVRLIASGAAGARAANPAAIIVSAAPATTGINDGIAAIDDRVFFRAMLQAGIDNHVDAVGVHPYGWANPPDSTVANPDPDIPSHNNHPSFFFADTLNDYAAILDEFGVNKPMWVTEFGWGTFEEIENDDGGPASPPAGAEFMNNVSEWQQAQYIPRAFELGQQAGNIGPMFLWNLNFGPTLGNAFSESGYSLLRPDGSERPSYLSLQNSQ